MSGNIKKSSKTALGIVGIVVTGLFLVACFSMFVAAIWLEDTRWGTTGLVLMFPTVGLGAASSILLGWSE